MSDEGFAGGAISRRHFALSAIAFMAAPPSALAQPAPPKQPSPEALTPAAPISIEVNARPIPFFDLRDRTRVTFGQLRFRSGLTLTSAWRGFGGLSALRVDEMGQRFVAISDKGAWFTGRIVYRGPEMTGFDDVETARNFRAHDAAVVPVHRPRAAHGETRRINRSAIVEADLSRMLRVTSCARAIAGMPISKAASAAKRGDCFMGGTVSDRYLWK